MSWIVSFVFSAVYSTLFSLISIFLFLIFIVLFKHHLAGRSLAMNIKYCFLLLTIILLSNLVLVIYYIFSDSVYIYILPIHFNGNVLSVILVFMMIWFVGFCYKILPYLLSIKSFSRNVKSALFFDKVVDVEVVRLLNDIKFELGIKCDINVLKTKNFSSPAVFGLRRPIILLPENMIEMTDLRVIFLHELTHIKNKDLLFKVLSKFLTAFFWFNPIILWLYGLLNKYMEFACDEMACNAGKHLFSAKEYFTTILKIKKNITYNTNFMATLLEKNSDIEGRICNMKKHTYINRRRLTFASAIGMLVITFTMFFSIYASAQTINACDNLVFNYGVHTEKQMSSDSLQVLYSTKSRDASTKEIPTPYISDTIKIDITANSGDVYSTVDFYKQEGENVRISLSFNPDNKDMKVGLFTPDGSTYVISSGSIDYTFDIDQSGYYAVFIENISDANVAATGYAHIN